jgi:hypothetical protein
MNPEKPPEQALFKESFKDFILFYDKGVQQIESSHAFAM